MSIETEFALKRGIVIAHDNRFSQSAEGFIKSNALHFEFEDSSFVPVRPSETESECKFYYCVRGESADEANSKMMKFKEVFKKIPYRITEITKRRKINAHSVF